MLGEVIGRGPPAVPQVADRLAGFRQTAEATLEVIETRGRDRRRHRGVLRHRAPGGLPAGADRARVHLSREAGQDGEGDARRVAGAAQVPGGGTGSLSCASDWLTSVNVAS